MNRYLTPTGNAIWIAQTAIIAIEEGQWSPGDPAKIQEAWKKQGENFPGDQKPSGVVILHLCDGGVVRVLGFADTMARALNPSHSVIV